MISHQSTIGVGVIGLGFMGNTHVSAYAAAAKAGLPCRIVAVCDARIATLKQDGATRGNMSTGSPGADILANDMVARFSDAQQLFARPQVDLVSICTYTDSHVELAMQALHAGKHVLVEKPVAIRPDDVRCLADAAKKSSRLCMPAMCMRFWPGWDWLRTRILDRTLGKTQSAVFQRLGSRPNWAVNFYGDPARSGGALVDLHIHDADFISWCFGPPRRVTTFGTADHLTTTYQYDDGPRHVMAEAAWDVAPAAGFRMRFFVTFDEATADFDSTRTPQLMLHHKDRSEAVTLEPISGYDREVRHIVAAITEGRRELNATLEEAVEVARLLECERLSLETRRAVDV